MKGGPEPQRPGSIVKPRCLPRHEGHRYEIVQIEVFYQSNFRLVR